MIKELELYKKEEKADIKSKKTDLEGMLEDIHESERAENRPMYIPSEGLGPNEISQKYRDVEEAENDYEERLLKKFKYYLAIEQLMNQLDRKCQRLNDRLLNNIEKINDFNGWLCVRRKQVTKKSLFWKQVKTNRLCIVQLFTKVILLAVSFLRYSSTDNLSDLASHSPN